jgi:dimethylargininase
MLTAITRGVSPEINQCELSHLSREPIDIEKAVEQHHQYEECLRELGAKVISLPAEPGLPDCMFVEDPALVLDEIAILTRMGAESRRREADSLAPVLKRYRPVHWLSAPGTLEGGDVLRVEKTLYVGLSARTNPEGVAELTAELNPLGYLVKGVQVRGCLHLKSAACYLGNGTLLAHRPWIDAAAFEGLEIVDVPERRAANVLAIGHTVMIAAGFPRTARLIESLGWNVRLLDISELMKAEAGLTCSSLLFDANE